MDDTNKEYEELEQEQEQSRDVSAMTDKELAKDPQKGFSRGVETDEYDILPEMDETAEEVGELDGKEFVEAEYSFNGAEVTEGLKIYQRETIYKKNLVYSILLLAIFLIYTVNIFRNPTEWFSILLAALCLAVLFFLWYLPKKHVKKTAEAADLGEMKFRMAVYDNCIRIREDGGGFILHYKKEVSKVFETPDLFLFCVGKERMFILPKRFLETSQTETVRGFLQEGMGELFVGIPVKE